MKGIAFYLRLSLSDSDLGMDNKDESNSIENQRKLLRQFVEKREEFDGEVLEYIDDGYSGTNFKRPAFQRMIEDAKKGIIDTIIAKDLSRLGRDYIMVGDYLEQIFPSLGIRFIAVTSNYDSNDYIGKTMGIDTSISNLINSMYSKDLSKKIHSSYVSLWKNGRNTNAIAPFGYIKDPKDSHKWLIDKDAAKIVKMIFKKACDGYNTKMIAEYLNKRKIPNPSTFYLQRDGNYPYYCRVISKDLQWDTAKVYRVLKHYEYTGALVHNRYKRVSLGDSRLLLSDKNDWIIVENDHPPIVSKDEYELAQLSIRSVKNINGKFSRGDLLTGKIRCGTCGLMMAYYNPSNPVIFCAHASLVGSQAICDRTRHQAKVIEAQVAFALKQQLTVVFQLGERLNLQHEKKSSSFASAQKQIKLKIESIKTEKLRQYESFANGNLSKEDFLKIKEKLTAECETLESQLGELTDEHNQEGDVLFDVNRLMTKGKSFFSKGKLTREAVEAFIKEVTIFSAERMKIEFTFEDVISKVQNALEQ